MKTSDKIKALAKTMKIDQSLGDLATILKEVQSLEDFGEWLCENYYPRLNSKKESCWVKQDWFEMGEPILDDECHSTDDLWEKFKR